MLFAHHSKLITQSLMPETRPYSHKP